MGAAAPLTIGRYVLHDEIASGGMAAVYFGRLVGTGGFSKTVAIKRLHRQLARTPSFRKMILEEGRLAARIRHPNVVPPLDVLAEAGELLLVMEYVHGESLSRLLKAAWAAGERIPIAVGAGILSNVLAGLHAAHEANDEAGKPLDIVHRDVSPQNVLVGVDGVARVIDFGIAKAVTSGESTAAGTIKGKVPYLAPEQLEGEAATRRTDVYAAAVVFWEVLAGRRLFDGEDDPEILHRILSMEVPPPSRHNPAVPGSVDDVVLRGLARKPAARFASAREMALALEDAVHPATPSVVGAWAERLAGDALAARAAKLAEVEAVAVSTAGEETVTEKGRRGPPPPSLTALLPQGSPPRVPSTPPPPPPTVKMAPVARGAAPPPPPVDETASPATPILTRSAPPPGPPAPPLPAPAALGSAPPPPPPVVVSVPPPPAPVVVSVPPPPMPEEPRLPPAGALRKPELEIPNVAWLPAVAPSASAEAPRRRLKPWIIFFLVVTLVFAWIALPFAVRKAYVHLAEKRGVVLAIDRVEISRRAIRLVDVRAEAGALPGVTARAGAVVLTGRLWAPETAVVDDLEVTLEGPASELLPRVEKFRAAMTADASSFGTLRRVDVTSGRVDWKDALGPGTSALAENVTFEATQVGARPIFSDFHALAPLVTLRVSGLAAGPWLIETDRQGPLTRTVLRLDPLGTTAGRITRTATDDGSIAVAFAVPPTRLADLHVPPRVLGALATDRTRVELQGEVTFTGAPPTGGPARASGRLVFAAGALAVLPGAAPLDVSLDIPIAGDPAAAIPLAGVSFAMGAADPGGGRAIAIATGTLEGELDASKPAPRLALAGKTTEMPCAKGTSTALEATIDVALDRIGDARLTFAPTAACTPRLR